MVSQSNHSWGILRPFDKLRVNLISLHGEPVEPSFDEYIVREVERLRMKQARI